LTGYVESRRQQSPSQQDMGTAVRTAKTSPASWDVFSHLVTFIEIAFVSILSRRIKRIVADEVCA
jgi:hypothetical protein